MQTMYWERVDLKLSSGQIWSAWEWYHWIGLEKDINRQLGSSSSKGTLSHAGRCCRNKNEEAAGLLLVRAEPYQQLGGTARQLPSMRTLCNCSICWFLVSMCCCWPWCTARLHQGLRCCWNTARSPPCWWQRRWVEAVPLLQDVLG